MRVCVWMTAVCVFLRLFTQSGGAPVSFQPPQHDDTISRPQSRATFDTSDFVPVWACGGFWCQQQFSTFRAFSLLPRLLRVSMIVGGSIALIDVLLLLLSIEQHVFVSVSVFMSTLTLAH